MEHELLINKMKKYEDLNDSHTYIKTVDAPDVSMKKIMELLAVAGSIVEEDLEANVYIAYIRSGLLKLNRTLVGFQLENQQLTAIGYSINDVTNHKGNEKVVNELLDTLFNKPKNGTKMPKKTLALIICAICAAGALAVASLIFVRPAKTASAIYNIAVEDFNKAAEEYNKQVVLVDTDNIEGLPGEVDSLKTVSTGFVSVTKSVLTGNSASKIKKDTETIYGMVDRLKDGEKIIALINNPKSQWIEDKLKNIDEIKEMDAVTSDNDPNGFLGKEHGYSSCIYFKIDGLELQNSNDKDPIALGTDGGGAIETYSNLEDAQARCEYLKQFDGTVLYTGSYTLVGTMVIRTSYALDEDQQYTITNKIVEQFVS